MNLTDTHAHLYLEHFKGDIDTVIQNAKDKSVNRIFLPSINSATIPDMLDLVKTYPGTCFPMMGLHPCNVDENFESELKIVKDELKKGTYVAVGETGLDFFHDLTFREQQEISLIRHIELAIEHKLALVLHTRNSNQEVYDLVKKHYQEGLKGIFHCFSGEADFAKKVTDTGFYLGIGGVLTFKNSGLREVVKNIPLEHIVLETDAPYITPVPFRGKRNESAYIYYIAQTLAEVKNVSIEEVAEVTSRNAFEVFGLLDVEF